MACGSGPVVHGDLAGGYAVSQRFEKCAVALRNVPYQDRASNEAELLFMDNHFQVLQMAYLRWKRKHRPTD